MAERKETKLWSLIRQGTKSFKVHWTRIENMVDTGTPDTWGVYQGVYFPVELKMVEGDWIYLRPAQVSWMRQHLIANGTPWLITRWDDLIMTVSMTNEILNMLIPKGKYLAIKASVLYDNQLYAHITHKPFKYEQILNTLIGGKNA